MKKTIITLLVAAFATAGCSSQENDNNVMENPVIEAIMSRRSIRHYTETPVEREKLQKLADCGINAPNAMNRQDWEVRIVDNQDYFDGVTRLMMEKRPGFVQADDPGFRNAFRNATAAIFIASPADDKSGMLLQNVGIMSENICLAAHSLGLGTCIMGAPAMFLRETPEAKPWLDRLAFSEGYRLQVVIAVGYPDETPDAKPRDPSKVRFID